MGDFDATWRLTRQRFDDAVLGLSAAQLNWRLHDEVLTIGQMAIHVAGVEASFITQLTGESLDEEHERVRKAATDGTINDNPFPFGDDEITPALVERCLRKSRALAEPVLSNPSPELRGRNIVSALGPTIDGTGALARLAYHPGYHQGQVHIVRTAPGFPAA
jgi:hypothetical protein